MSKFKVGDKVRFKDDADNRLHGSIKRGHVKIGDTYVVEKLYYFDDPDLLKLVDNEESFFVHRFELVEDNPPPPITAGNRVRITSNVMSVFNNRVGTVTEVSVYPPDDVYPYEVFLDDGYSVPFSANELTVIPPPEPDHIVILVDDGVYAPADTPRVIRSRDAAEKVAERMTEKYGGEFAVFARVA